MARERSSSRERNFSELSHVSKSDFIKRLFFIFVDNLHPKVDLIGLWGIFKPFGKVRDVYFSAKSESRKSNFAFI